MKFQYWVAKNKTRMHRGYSYISVAAIPFLVAREIQNIFPMFSWWFILLCGLVSIWLMGYIDTERGFLESEQDFAFKKNPEWMNRGLNQQLGENK